MIESIRRWIRRKLNRKIEHYTITLTLSGYEDVIIPFNQLIELSYLEVEDFVFSEIRVRAKDINKITESKELSKISEKPLSGDDIRKLSEKLKSKILQNIPDNEIHFEINEEQHNYDKTTISNLLHRIHQIGFPISLYNLFQSEWNLSEQKTIIIFQEYAKFLAMMYFTQDKNPKITPGFWIDQLWHMHITFTKHYRETCLNLFGQVFSHQRNFFTEVKNKNIENASENTEFVYGCMFEGSMPEGVWAEAEEEFLGFNLYRFLEQRGMVGKGFGSWKKFDRFRYAEWRVLYEQVDKNQKKFKKTKDFDYNGDNIKAERIKHYKKGTILTKTWRSNYSKYYTNLLKSSDENRLDIMDEDPVCTKGGPLFNLRPLEKFVRPFDSSKRRLEIAITNQIQITYKNVEKC